MLIKVIGILILIMGIVYIVNAILERKKCLNIVEGKVINIIERSDADSPTGMYFTPVFEYIVNYEKYLKESQVSAPTNKYCVGQSIKICYNVKNPKQCYEETLNHTVIIILGVLCIIIGFLFMLFY